MGVQAEEAGVKASPVKASLSAGVVGSSREADVVVPGTPPSASKKEVSSKWWTGAEEGRVRHERKQMLRTLAALLKAKGGAAGAMAATVQKYPVMARRLEEHLLRTSESLETYKDPNTLKERLRQIAKRAKATREAGPSAGDATGSVSIRPSHHHRRGACQVPRAVSLLDTMPRAQVEAHARSLRVDDVKERGKRAIEEACKQHKLQWLFNEPVDPVKLGIPDYPRIITRPMDLGTIRKRLDRLEYDSLEAVAADCSLCFENARVYNGAESDIGKGATELEALVKAALDAEVEKSKADDPKADGRCSLCRRGRLKVAPLAYRCDGAACQGQRIRRGAPAFFDPRARRRYCRTCLEKQGVDPYDPNNGMIKERAGDDDDAEESWVQCSKCESWVHQVCGLFNGRANDADAVYLCPDCKCHQPVTSGVRWRASELTETELSVALQKRVSEAAELFRKQAGDHRYVGADATPLLVREVSDAPEAHLVKPLLAAKLGAALPQSEHGARSRCVALFQTVDGVDVVLLCMYVYEYETGPNAHRLYLSYLDSVSYLRPKEARTPVYHALLVGYLADAKRRGFEAAHIWACPPKRGDDYIFNIKPKHQRTPTDDRLKKWYGAALEAAKVEGIVTKISTFWDDHLAEPVAASTPDAQVFPSLPYFEGDFWPAEVERLLDAETKAHATDAAADANDPDSPGGSSATGATVVAKPPSKKKKKLASQRQRAAAEPPTLLSRLAKTMQPMKDNFLVAHLRDDAATTEPVPEALSAAETSAPAAAPEAESASVSNERQESANNPPRRAAPFPESDILRTRQHFLDVCQGNHYQFDELRRAKHATMMVLYHMHTPDAPLFPSSCLKCGVEIGDGARSPTHAICRECQLKQQAEPRGTRVRRPSARAVEAEADRRTVPPIVLSRSVSLASAATAPVARAEGIADMDVETHDHPRPPKPDAAHKAKLLDSLLGLLEHASECRAGPNCEKQLCVRMQQQLEHFTRCRIPNRQVDCRDCRRLYTLIQIHARSCRRASCPVPYCAAFKHKILAKQKAAAAAAARAAQDPSGGG